MAEYSINIVSSAAREIKKLEKHTIIKVLAQLDEMRLNPLPTNSKRLTGKAVYYRVRLGDYRIIYDIDMDSKLVTVYKVAHRKDVYRGY